MKGARRPSSDGSPFHSERQRLCAISAMYAYFHGCNAPEASLEEVKIVRGFSEVLKEAHVSVLCACQMLSSCVESDLLGRTCMIEPLSDRVAARANRRTNDDDLVTFASNARASSLRR